MTAVPVATRGYFCEDQPIGIATRGYFCFGIVIAEPEEDFGGSQFPDKRSNPWLVFKPITDMMDGQLPVDAKVLPYAQESDTEFLIDGKKYTLVEAKSPSEIIKAAPDVDRLLDEAVEKLGVTKRKAKKELYNQVITKLKEVESVKDSVFNDDDEIIMILVATDDL